MRKRVSGGEEVAQMCSEVKASSKQDRAKLVEELKKTTGSLALKADLQIPWNKLRIVRRSYPVKLCILPNKLPFFFYTFSPFLEKCSIGYASHPHCRMLGSNVKLASEKDMRAESSALVGQNLKATLTPFSRHTVEIRNVPMCYTPDLWQKIEDLLNANDLR